MGKYDMGLIATIRSQMTVASALPAAAHETPGRALLPQATPLPDPPIREHGLRQPAGTAAEVATLLAERAE
ncbi:MAG: hypothetical protein HC844_21410, partial [Tabrizicola sp.]|nr:hypothetical protein [Tabrizicola sp.]